MSKVNSPVLSLGARGSLGDTISFTRRRGVNILEKKPIPTDARTLTQMYQRWEYQDYSAWWHELTAAEKLFWRKAGSRLGITGFNAFMSNRLLTLPDLAGRWRMDERTGVVAADSSPYSNHASLHGPQHVAGVIDYGLRFDGGDDWANCGNIPDLGQEFSLLFFTKRLGSTGTGAGLLSIDIHSWSVTGGLYIYDYNSQHLRLFVRNHPDVSQASLDWKPAFPDLIPQHLAITWKRPDLTIYWNGAYKDSVFWDHDIGWATYRLRLGRYPGKYYFGILDNLEIYTRVLTPSDILRHSLRGYPL